MATTTIELRNSYARDLPELVVAWTAEPVVDPRLVALNGSLADELGLDRDWLDSPDGLGLLTGTDLPPGVEPVAMGYAGHQFGNYNPQLGDGRALLLGELDVDGALVDLHLKGSGRTPFARNGDGRATLGPMLREFVIAEAMHALGIPTTRSLAVVTTGESIARQRVEPGAILARTAASHLRVGTFQYARFRDPADPELVQRLVAHALRRHHPEGLDADRPALALLDHVTTAQAQLVAAWMTVGFIHGVMNTDNMAISGEGIDYGPCAFLDRFDPATVFSSIDHGGRYAYGNQPAIAQWNLTRLAEAILGAIDEDVDTAKALAVEILEDFPLRYQEAWTTTMCAKLGLPAGAADRPGTSDLLDGLLALQTRTGADHTRTYRSLAASLRGDEAALVACFGGLDDEVAAWLAQWHAALGPAADDEGEAGAVADGMDAVNPVFIPRNHLVEASLDAAIAGDLAPFHELLAAVTSPFDASAGPEHLSQPAPEGFAERYRTFCGT